MAMLVYQRVPCIAKGVSSKKKVPPAGFLVLGHPHWVFQSAHRSREEFAFSWEGSFLWWTIA